MKEINAGKRLKIWMLMNEVRAIDLAAEANVHRSFVTNFIAGRSVSKGFAEYLINKGCPASYFENGRLKAA